MVFGARAGVFFYRAATTPAFARIDVPFEATRLVMTNDDGAASVEFSFDGVITAGVVRPGEVLTLGQLSYDVVHVRDFVSGAPAEMRLWSQT
jgi:hypothetical protein